MTHTVRFIARAELAPGVGLTAVPTLAAEDGRAAGRAVTELANDARVGVVLIESRLHDAMPEDVVRALSRRPTPVVVPFPSPVRAARPGAAEEYIIEMLRRAIGYRIRLR